MNNAGEIMKHRAHALARARPGKAYFIQFERKQNWSRALPIYVIWCSACQVATETHPAGYGRITCLTCRKTVDKIMTWPRFRDKTLPSMLTITPLFGIIFLAFVALALSMLR